MIRVRQNLSITPSGPPLVVGRLYGMRVIRRDTSGGAIRIAWTALTDHSVDSFTLTPEETGWIAFPGGVLRAEFSGTATFDLWWAESPGDSVSPLTATAAAATYRQELVASINPNTNFAGSFYNLARPAWARRFELWAATSAGPGIAFTASPLFDLLASLPGASSGGAGYVQIAAAAPSSNPPVARAWPMIVLGGGYGAYAEGIGAGASPLTGAGESFRDPFGPWDAMVLSFTQGTTPAAFGLDLVARWYA